MTAPEPIIRIAAKGDGITASGRFAWGAAPGDLLHEDGRLEPGPNHLTQIGRASCRERVLLMV